MIRTFEMVTKYAYQERKSRTVIPGIFRLPRQSGAFNNILTNSVKTALKSLEVRAIFIAFY